MFNRLFIFFCIFILCTLHLHAQFRAASTISDSIDILHYNIALHVTDYAAEKISGNAVVRFSALVDDISELPLDLLALHVDSVETAGGTNIPFFQTGETLRITLPTVLDTGDDDSLKIFYQGSPAQDGSWGGWYWSADYSYQLGVGFDAIPHNFGRVWFPCFDNFVERSAYHLEITTPAEKKAFCGGLLQEELTNADGTKTWIYDIGQQIPSYLVSVAVANYTTVNMLYEGIERDIPMQIGVKAEDSTDLKNSFVHLQNAMQIFEEHYGPYQWDRVGYVIVPFSGGAMEHAMNIAYPLFAVTGTTAYEILYAHELSHHWWGDLVTCRTANEMWINEGWASYSELLFNEYLYGEDAYRSEVKSNHTFVLQYAAANDGNNYFALSNMPEAYTYGTTTYKKGEDVISTLRSYMGDADFFSCAKDFLADFAFRDVSATDMENAFSTCSGTDLSSFFDNWIWNPGFPAFEIEDFNYTDAGTVDGICIEQKLKHAPAYFTNVPLTISFFDEHWQIYHEENIMMSGEQASFSLPEITKPYAAIIDYHDKISDAVTADEMVMKTPGDYYFPNAFVTVTPSVLSDSAIIYGAQYWVAGDNFKATTPGLHINTQRYWKFQGKLPIDFQASAVIKFNGKVGVSGGNQDNEFMNVSEDSLVLLYRADQYDEWEIYPYYTKNNFGSAIDKYGQFELDTFLLGEYAIGKYDISIPDSPADTLVNCPDILLVESENSSVLKVYPNPANHFVTIDLRQMTHVSAINIYDSTGRKVKSIQPQQNTVVNVELKDLSAGAYEIKCTSVDNSLLAAQKLIIIR